MTAMEHASISPGEIRLRQALITLLIGFAHDFVMNIRQKEMASKCGIALAQFVGLHLDRFSFFVWRAHNFCVASISR